MKSDPSTLGMKLRCTLVSSSKYDIIVYYIMMMSLTHMH